MGEYLSDQFNIKKDPSMLVASWQAEVSEQWTSAVSPMGWSSGALREVPYSHGGNPCGIFRPSDNWLYFQALHFRWDLTKI